MDPLQPRLHQATLANPDQEVRWMSRPVHSQAAERVPLEREPARMQGESESYRKTSTSQEGTNMWQIFGALNEIPSSQDAYVTHTIRFLITSMHLGVRASTENYLI